MRVLVLYAHPVATSYGAALHRAALEGLREAGHDVDDCDLYAEGFDPVMSAEERAGYHDLATNRAPVAGYVDRLLAAEGLVIVSPIWNLGHPAILKGFFDRVFLPGVTFAIRDGRLGSSAMRLKALAAVHTYGGPRGLIWLTGDPPRRVVNRLIGSLVAAGGTKRYLTLYGMNRASQRDRETFSSKVRREMATL
ncbi:MAG: NAD(P)H-dependent oxidoreductase [Pseudomonadota bacterium]